MHSVCIVEIRHCQQCNNYEYCKKKMLLWRIYFTGKDKKLLDIHVKCLRVLPNFNQTWNS